MVEKIAEKLSHLSKRGGFYYFGEEVGGLQSGWKFHIFGETIEDSLQLYKLLNGVAKKWGATGKIGGAGKYNNGAQMYVPSHGQWGKQGATLYIPPKVLKSGKQGEMLRDIQNKLANYNKSGKISGDKMLDDQVAYRYELGKSIDPTQGVDMKTYANLYSSNVSGGKYKIDDIQDIF